jgi:hypothetical protein
MTRPFKSKFIPYVEDIKKWRRAGDTWEQVAKKLTDEKGIKADAGNVCRVMGRIKRRPFPLGAEPEEVEKKTTPATPPESLHRAAVQSRKQELEQAKEPEVSDWDAFSIDPDQELEKPNT